MSVRTWKELDLLLLPSKSSLRALVFSACAVVPWLAAGSAGAATISATDLPNFVQSANVGGVVFDAGAGSFLYHKTVAGTEGVGVGGAGNIVSGEIDAREQLAVSFAGDVFVTEITLGFLYLKGNEGDETNETARIFYGSEAPWRSATSP
jgi:hypothetical protein